MERGTYLTDGANLYHLLGFHAEGVYLEDCYLGETITLSYEELAKMNLRKVEREPVG
jgi:hypothetical protein